MPDPQATDREALHLTEPTEAEWLEGRDPMTQRDRMEAALGGCWRCPCVESDGLVCARCAHIHQAPSAKEWSNV